VVVTNNQDKPSFMTTISSTTRAIIGKISVPGISSIEQPAYHSIFKKFFLSIPSYPKTPALAGGTIFSLSLATLSIEETFPLLECIPAGIAFPAKHSTHLFIGCCSDQITAYNYAASYMVNVALGVKIIANLIMLSEIDRVVYSEWANV
jgi:hypothetical protein